MDSAYMFSSYQSFKDDSRGAEPVPLHHCDDDFLKIIGLYSGFCKFRVYIEGQKDYGAAHSHGGAARKLFGSGGFSNAVQISDTRVAKIPRVLPGNDGFDKKRYFRDIITELRVCLWEPIRVHPNIISLEDIQWFPGPHPTIPKNWNYMWPALEYETADGTLTSFLHKCQDVSFSDKMGILFDIAKALDCLHKHGVVHSDVKPDNILLFPDPQQKHIAKLTDFGCSKILEQEETHGYLLGGTRIWSAPEAGDYLSHEELCKTDIYSFGLVAWYVITNGYGPFGWLKSLFDTASFSQEDIENLKEQCFLELSHESLSELPLSELEMRFSTEIMDATLCPNSARAKLLAPIFKKYSHLINSEGDQNKKISPGEGGEDEGFIGPIALVNVKYLIHKPSMDDRVRVQTFSCIKDIVSSGDNAIEEFTPGSVLWQLFLCYYYGFGTARDLEAAISALTQACELGHMTARGLIVQFHQAHGVELSPDLPVVEWLEEHVRKGDIGTSKALKSVDLEAYQRITREVQNTILACDGCVVPGGDHNLLAHPQTADGVLQLIEPLFADYNPVVEVLIHMIEQDLGSLTQNRLIHFAAAAGMTDVVRGLLDNNICDPQVKTTTGLTPLCFAFRGGHRDTALLLLSRIPYRSRGLLDFNSGPIFERHCLQDLSAFDPSDRLEVATYAVQKIIDAETIPAPLKSGKPCTPMMKAILNNSLESVKVLLQLGACGGGENIATAAEHLNGDILNLLLWDLADKGRELDIVDLENIYYLISSNADPLDTIQRHGFEHSYEIIRTFETIDYFVRLWQPDSYFEIQEFGFQALYAWRRYDIIQLVLDPFFKDHLLIASETKYPPLWWSMRLGDMESFSLFLEYGATKNADTPIVFSKSIKVSNPFFVAELIKHGCLLSDYEIVKYSDGGICNDIPPNIFCLTPFETAVIFDCFDTAVQLYRDTGRHVGWDWDVFLLILVMKMQHGGLSKLDFVLNFYKQEKVLVLPPCQGGTTLHRMQTFWCVEPEERRGEIRNYMIQIVKRLSHMVNARSFLGGTPIFGASIHHNVLLVEALIESGADLDIKDNQGFTTLDVILVYRIWQVLRLDPYDPNPPPRVVKKRCRRTPKAGDAFWADADTSMGTKSGPGTEDNPIYRGDAYDKRLDKIYLMIREAGGSSTINGSYSRVETLGQWTEFWIRRNKERVTGERCVDKEEYELMERFVRLWGPLWDFPSFYGLPMQFVAGSWYYKGLGKEDLHGKTPFMTPFPMGNYEPKSGNEVDEVDSGVSDT